MFLLFVVDYVLLFVEECCCLICELVCEWEKVIVEELVEWFGILFVMVCSDLNVFVVVGVVLCIYGGVLVLCESDEVLIVVK